ncbi:MAG: hypothetical protein J1F17_07800, partial [Oscillospiraceae bacterium]|nr:hypothetical protein [Oscillospiraceae bacterium]
KPNNAPPHGADGIMLVLKDELGEVTNITQVHIGMSNTVYKRSYSYNNRFQSGSWSEWIKIADDLSLYALTKDVNAGLAQKANKEDVETALANKADKATTLAGYGITDTYTKDEVHGITKTITGKGLINLPDTVAGSKLLAVSTDSNYLIKNKNMYEYYVGYVYGATATTDGESYTITKTKEGDAYFANIPNTGGAYTKYNCGNKFAYKEGLIITTIYSDNTKNKTFIAYYDENDTCLLRKSYLVDGNTFALPQVENAKYFVVRFDIPATLAVGDSITVKIQIECGDTATDYVAPQSNTQGITYRENTNIICDSECTVKYVPEVYTKSEIKKYIDERLNNLTN